MKAKFLKNQIVKNTNLNWTGAIVIKDLVYPLTGTRVIRVKLAGSIYEWLPKNVELEADPKDDGCEDIRLELGARLLPPGFNF